MTIKVPSPQERVLIETRFERAKQRRPYIEIINDGISKMKLDADLAERLYKAALQARWENLNEDEIFNKLEQLKGII